MRRAASKIRSCRAGYLTRRGAFGRQMSGYNIPFMDMRYCTDTAEKKEKPVVPLRPREYGASRQEPRCGSDRPMPQSVWMRTVSGTVSPMGGKVISTTLPDFSTAGAVKTGSVEMVAAYRAPRESLATGVLRNFKGKVKVHMMYQDQGTERQGAL